MAAIGCVVFDLVQKPGFLADVRTRAQALRAGLERLARRHAGQVRGKGLLLGLAFERDIAERIRDDCYERGLLVNAARPNVLRFMPQLRVSDEEVNSALELLGQSLRACETARSEVS